MVSGCWYLANQIFQFSVNQSYCTFDCFADCSYTSDLSNKKQHQSDLLLLKPIG